jgi:hypothetical protein
MADKKISALTAASTPLAGTEVLPIVQSGATVKVAVSDLTAGRSVSTASLTTNGKLTTSFAAGGSFVAEFQNTSSATPYGVWVRDAATPVAGYPLVYVSDSTGATNYFRVDSSNGNTTVGIGNLVIGTSGKGIDFSATPGTGTSELFADYEEGTFTPTVVGSTSAGTATYSGANGRYTKVGRIVEFEIYLDWTSGTGTGNLLFGGLPFTANASLPYASVTIGYIHNFTWTALKYPMALTIGTQVNFFLQQLGGGAIASMGYSASGTTYVSGTYTV